jgi:hypothetical protein
MHRIILPYRDRVVSLFALVTEKLSYRDRAGRRRTNASRHGMHVLRVFGAQDAEARAG